MTGVSCDRMIAARVKGKVCEIVVSPAMMYSLETVVLTNSHEVEIEVVELKML